MVKSLLESPPLITAFSMNDLEVLQGVNSGPIFFPSSHYFNISSIALHLPGNCMEKGANPLEYPDLE